MRILWFSNALFEKMDRGVTGTWLHAMSKGLTSSGKVELANITPGKVKSLVRQDYEQIKQWVVPFESVSKTTGLPGNRLVQYYLDVIEEFKPDLIHVWGVESFPALITSRYKHNIPSLLEIQGIAGIVAKYVDGGLSFGEIVRCIGLKELLLRSSIFQTKQSYERWGYFEEEMIRNHQFITVPSTWMLANVKFINSNATLFQNEIPLRKEFFQNIKWHFSDSKVILCSSSSPIPNKGFHVLIRALKLLRNVFPDIQLRIAGAHQFEGIRKNGYITWLNKLIQENGLESHVTWLGSLSSEQLIPELLNCSVMALPSYVESYGVAHAEAMALGVPCVCAFNGGSSYLAENELTSLFFQAGDHVICAHQIARLLTSKELAESISVKAREKAIVRNDTNVIIAKQIQIYEEVLIKSKQYSKD